MISLSCERLREGEMDIDDVFGVRERMGAMMEDLERKGVDTPDRRRRTCDKGSGREEVVGVRRRSVEAAEGVPEVLRCGCKDVEWIEESTEMVLADRE